MKRSVILKFGGASIETPHHFKRIAAIVSKRKEEYENVAVVVSAMGSTTDQLIQLAHAVNPSPPKREYDMLISAGERMSIALLAMALDKEKCQGISFTGSQSGVITDVSHAEARIIDVKPHRILEAFEQNKVAIIAGFQGVSLKKEITTLGRGGSDTTAVALGIALKASKVEFFKDVNGIYSVDPKTTEHALFYSSLTYSEALEIVTQGHGVIHPRAIELAQKNQLTLRVLSFQGRNNSEKNGTWIYGSTHLKSLYPLYEDVSLNLGIA